LRKYLAKVKTALPDVPSDDVEEYVKTGKLVVGGIELVEGDLQVQRYIELPAGHETQYTTHTDNEVVVRLDTKACPELNVDIRMARAGGGKPSPEAGEERRPPGD